MTSQEPTRSRATRGRCALRLLVRGVVGCGVLALLVDTWLLEGMLAPVIVASGSMAPALVGPHRQWLCAGCGRVFVCGLESLPAPGASAVCPNCGAENDADQGEDRLGDRVLIDRSAFLWRSPRRWEAVVFRCPDDARMLCVKRVVGLPGETVQIQEGDVLVNGAVAPKDFAAGQAMAVRVYDTPQLDQRWQSEPVHDWQSTPEGYVHPEKEEKRRGFGRANPPLKPVDWLTYHHEQRFVGGERAGPIMDESAYDQNESRELTAVSDVALRCRIQADGRGAVFVRARSRTDEFLARVDVETGEGELVHNGRVATLIAAAAYPFGNFAQLDFIVADHRVLLGLRNSLLVEHDYQPAQPTATSSSPDPRGDDHPLSIGAQGALVELRNLQILRDVFYTAGPREAARGQVQLGPGEYFLLGDNSPHALDSRAWSPGGGLSDTMLVGRVLVW
jgi:signal peptidase I